MMQREPTLWQWFAATELEYRKLTITQPNYCQRLEELKAQYAQLWRELECSIDSPGDKPLFVDTSSPAGMTDENLILGLDAFVNVLCMDRTSKIPVEIPVAAFIERGQVLASEMKNRLLIEIENQKSRAAPSIWFTPMFESFKNADRVGHLVSLEDHAEICAAFKSLEEAPVTRAEFNQLLEYVETSFRQQKLRSLLGGGGGSTTTAAAAAASGLVMTTGTYLGTGGVQLIPTGRTTPILWINIKKPSAPAREMVTKSDRNAAGLAIDYSGAVMAADVTFVANDFQLDSGDVRINDIGVTYDYVALG